MLKFFERKKLEFNIWGNVKAPHLAPQGVSTEFVLIEINESRVLHPHDASMSQKNKKAGQHIVSSLNFGNFARNIYTRNLTFIS